MIANTVFRAAALLLVLPGLAVAQSIRGDDERSGVRVGGFRIQPSINTGAEYDTNLFRENVNVNDSFILSVNPEVDIVSDWNRHGLRLSLGAEYGSFTNDFNDNYFDYDVELAGVLDISRTMRLTGSIGYLNGHEARGSDDIAETARAVEPTETNTLSISILGEGTFGRFLVAPFFDARFREFDDVDLQAGGGVLNNDDRDRIEFEAGVEVSYEVRSGFSAFLRPSYLDVNYADGIDDTGVNRDAEGYRVLAGMKVDLTRLIQASVGLGYTSFDYVSPALDDFSGFAVDVQGVWSVTPRLQLTFGASRSVAETTVAGASGAIQLGGQVGAEYSLLRNVVLRANAGFLNVDYDGANRTDNLFNAGFGVGWRVTRDLTVSPSYRFGLRDTTAVGLGFRDHRVGVDASYRF